MAKKLTLTFNLADGNTMDVSISQPEDGLTLAVVQGAAADILAVLEGTNGNDPVALKEAKYITTTTELLA